jgi:hypothetical protein
VLQTLQDEHGRALADGEARAVAVEGAAGLLGPDEIRGQNPGLAVGAHPFGRQARIAAAGQGHVGQVRGHGPERLAQGLGGGRAGRHDGQVLAVQAECFGQGRGQGVGQAVQQPQGLVLARDRLEVRSQAQE